MFSFNLLETELQILRERTEAKARRARSSSPRTRLVLQAKQNLHTGDIPNAAFAENVCLLCHK